MNPETRKFVEAGVKRLEDILRGLRGEKVDDIIKEKKE